MAACNSALHSSEHNPAIWVPCVIIDAGIQHGMEAGELVRVGEPATHAEALKIAEAECLRRNGIGFTLRRVQELQSAPTVH